MTAPTRKRSSEPRHDPRATPSAAPASEPTRELAADETVSPPTSSDFAWPPPPEDLDALDVVLLRSPTPPDAMPFVQPPRTVRTALRARLSRIAATAALVLIALIVGILLGARHARRATISDASRASLPTAAPREMNETPRAPLAAAAPAGSAEPRSRPPAADAAVRADADAKARENARANANTRADVPVRADPSTTPASARVTEPPAADAGRDRRAASLDLPRLPDAQPLTEVSDAIGALPPIASPAARAEAAGIVGPAADVARVRQTLARYEHAYDTLDARAAAALRPSLDVAALTRAFGSLKSQSLTFDRCTVVVRASTATASCTGVTTVVRQVGSATPIREALQWMFTLRRAGDGWVVETVQTTR